MAQRVPFTGDEKICVHTGLEHHRDVVLWKIGAFAVVGSRKRRQS